ncbi:hypothetical protein RA27_04390 [Ruegeria sp. ANG-R]|nr:hypothetical protein RA27_04390 [Ruegeria sp. ANG-R]
MANEPAKLSGYAIVCTVETVPIMVDRLAQHAHGASIGHEKIMPPIRLTIRWARQCRRAAAFDYGA